MDFLKLKTFDNKEMTVCVWDKVKDPIAGIVINHGMSEHAERYDEFAKFLNENGYVVLAGNHRAHKYNVNGEKTIIAGDNFEETLEDIRIVVEYTNEKYNVPVVMLGHSYGSFLSQRFIELNSKMLSGCILVGTAHMKGNSNPLLVGFVGLINLLAGKNKPAKLIDKLSFSSYNNGFEDEGDFAWLSRDPNEVQKYRDDEYCGYVQSNGFYYYFLKGMRKLYKKDAQKISKNFPILITFGGDDPVSKKGKLAYKLRDFYVDKLGLKKVDIKEYEGGRHEILKETNKQEVYQDILAYINSLFSKKPTKQVENE